jgi:glutathione S-transferase
MREKRVCEPKIAFGVLEIDRIDLVGHRRRAHLAFDQALLEISERDIAPQIARQIDQNGIGAHQRVAILGDPIVRFDLGGVRVRL